MTNRGEKISEAADLLVSLLAGTELPSVEVYRTAKERGISKRTLERAKLMVGAKSRCVYYVGGKAWHLSVPEEMKGRLFSKPKTGEKLKPQKNRVISSDWVSVITKCNSSAEDKIDIPDRQASKYEVSSKTRIGSPKMSVKVGAYAFEVDEDFPADKLAQLLRGLEVAAV